MHRWSHTKQVRTTSCRIPTVAQWVNGLGYLCGTASSILSPVQWIKDPVLTATVCRWQMQLIFGPWPGNFICHGCGWKREEKKKKRWIERMDSSLIAVFLYFSFSSLGLYVLSQMFLREKPSEAKIYNSLYGSHRICEKKLERAMITIECLHFDLLFVHVSDWVLDFAPITIY